MVLACLVWLGCTEMGGVGLVIVVGVRVECIDLVCVRVFVLMIREP